MNNTQKILIATLVGAVAGLVAGILIAPDKGSETRKKVADTTKKVVGNVKEYAQTSASAVSGIKDKLFKKGENLAENMVENSRG